MTSLPTDPFTLKGGCFCTAITYTISVPALASRPAMPDRPVKYLLGPQSATSKRLPIITLDHCTSCRRISGSVLETWFVCPQSWVSFSLANRAFSERVEISHAGEVVRPKEAMLEKTHLRYFSSSENTHRTFCGKCGTHLTFHYSGSDDEVAAEDKWGPHFDVAVGSMERGSLEMCKPWKQSWVDDGIGWVKRMVKDGEKGLSM